MLWVVGLPGAGKTSAAAQWVHNAEARGERCIWYRLDEDDADVGGLLDTLRSDVRHGAPERLPVWSPDHQADPRRFARRFFSQLGAANDASASASASSPLPPPRLTLVFDDCHRIPDNSSFFEMLDAAREIAGLDLRLLLISRRPPPSLLQRGLLAGWLRVHDDLGLTLVEATAVAESSSGRRWEAADIEQLRKADGWMAHVLALARAAPGSEAQRASAELSSSASGQVGEFLSHELLLMLPAQERQHFRLLAELPEVPRALRGIDGVAGHVRPASARLLDQLAARQYFVDLTPANAWRLHDLLRDALLAQNQLLETAPDLALARRALAACVLPHAADTAMNLLAAAADVEGALALLQQHGRDWLAQGRHAQVLGWLTQLQPGDNAQALLWQAEALLPSQPEAARPLFSRARAMLVGQWQAQQGDAPQAQTTRAARSADAYRSWCGEVASYVVQWGAVQGLAELVDELERLEAVLGTAPDEWRFRTAADALTALMYGRAEDPRIRHYAKATDLAVQQAPDAGSRIVAAGQLMIYRLWWAGDFASGRALYDSFDAEVEHSSSLPPLARLIWWSNSAILDWQCGDPARCYSKVDRGLALAEASGVHVRNFFLLTQGIFCALSTEDWPRAEAYLARLAQTERDHKRLDAMVHHFFRSWYALSRGDAATALAHAQTAWPLAEAMGSLFHKVIVLSALAPAALHTGDLATAQQAYRQQVDLARMAQNPTFGYIAFCAGAEIALVTGDDAALAKQLERMLATKAMGGFHSDCGWRTPVRAQQLAFALDHGVLPDVARQWILEKRIPAPVGRVGDWPRPVQIAALGRLAVTVDGKNSESAQQGSRMRDFLSVLVAHRDGVSQDQLQDWLWPDADGDKAAVSLKSGIHRLRTWLGSEAVLVRNGVVSLNQASVGCDLWLRELQAPKSLVQGAAQVLAGCNLLPVLLLRQRLARL
jgi:hypothetical protein